MKINSSDCDQDESLLRSVRSVRTQRHSLCESAAVDVEEAGEVEGGEDGREDVEDGGEVP